MLDLTPKTHVNRSGVLINPCKTCQPVGALFAALGVAIPLLARVKLGSTAREKNLCQP